MKALGHQKGFKKSNLFDSLLSSSSILNYTNLALHNFIIILNIYFSRLSEAFYNATGSYQLTPMELFEKFCSQDFTGLYKHESINEVEDTLEAETGNHTYKGAIKKSSSLRKTTLLKQNSEPKFNIKLEQFYANPQEAFEEEDIETTENEEEYECRGSNVVDRRSSFGRQIEFDQHDQYFDEGEDQLYVLENSEDYRNIEEEDIDEIYLMPGQQKYDSFLRNSDEILAIDETDEEALDSSENSTRDKDVIFDNGVDGDFYPKQKLYVIYDTSLKSDESSEVNSNDDSDKNLKTIITEYVKNACASAANESIVRSQSMDLLSNSSATPKTYSNSEYAFDTVKQIHLDSCSTSKLSLSLNSDIFDDITLAAPDENSLKPIKICEMDDFTLTPDGSMCETNNNGGNIVQMSEQERIKNELQSQYTIIDCDELEHDGQEDIQKSNDDKSSFAEALNKEFDKLFSRAKNDSDTDITTTPSVATVLTAIKMPSRCSMEKLEALPFEFDEECIIGGINEEKENPTTALLSQSMTSATLHQSISSKKEEAVKSKSKRSRSLGALHKKKSSKCTPL